MNPESGPLRTALGAIPRYLGAAIGGVVTAQIGDPLTGAMFGEVMRQAGEDFANRALSTREETRVASVLEAATQIVAQRVQAGDSLRADWHMGENPEAVEVVEGVLRAARDEHQEKKLPYMANLLANLAFDTGIDAGTAYIATDDAENLSWVDCCILSIVMRPTEFPLRDTPIEASGSTWGHWSVGISVVELMEKRGMLRVPETVTEPLGLPMFDLRMSKLELTNRSHLVASLMGLKTIPSAEIVATHSALLVTAEVPHESGRD